MRKILLILAFLITGFGADAATQRPTNARAARGNTPVAQTASRGRSATQTPTAPTTSTRTTITSSQSTQRTSGNAASTGAVVSRAAKQNVISTGTKVAAAAQNTVVDEKCWNGFMGCMDSFCMLDNANGGRCMCSDKNAEYDSILAEIQSLDEQSYQMATVGVERIEMGDDANAVIKKTQEITKSIEKNSTQSKRNSLDLSAWNFNEIDFDADTEDIFSLGNDGSSITNKTGDALYRAAAKLCNAQMPECKSQSTMMDLMYKQRVRSDCTAYENSLRQQRTQSAQKLATAQSAMREAALEQYRNANKYDLGQCTVQFKQCMQTTGGCGDDFSGCVGLTQEYSSVKNIDKIKQKKISGAFADITIAQSTYDILESKRPLCTTVTQQCVNVRDQVWDTFLREIVPQVKSAELMAESNLRTSCISNIANCFQKACKDTMDPNDPDGSYDMCLTRPETLSSACKVEITPCEKAIPNIMDYVSDRLLSMRVDSCTKEFKQCLTSEDRCGADYTQCVGLDTDTIVRMCPADKLPGCKYGEADKDDYVYKNLSKIATGIFLNIDNNMLATCQKALDTAMLRVCGNTENCDELVIDNGTGKRSIEYQVCKVENYTFTSECYSSIDGISTEKLKDNEWGAKITGLIYWGEISYTAESNTNPNTQFSFTPIDKYMDNVAKATLGQDKTRNDLDDETKEIIRDRVYNMEIKALTSAVENAINAIESDQTVQYCMTGRKFQGYQEILGTVKKVGNKVELDTDKARFPNLTRQIRQIIANSALKTARDNYMEKYDTEIQRAMKDQVTAAKRYDSAAAKKTASETCAAWKNNSALPKAKTPKTDTDEGYIETFSAIATILFANPFLLIPGFIAANDTSYASTETEDWNYKEVINTMFNEVTGECTKIRTSQNCAEIEGNVCTKWEEPVETVTTVKLWEE